VRFHFFIKGEKAVRECIQQGRVMAGVCQDPHKTMIQRCCDDLDKLMAELATLRSQGKVEKDD